MAPSLEHVFTMSLDTSPESALVIPNAKGDNSRIVAFLTRGYIKGSQFDAELLPGSADWILVYTMRRSYPNQLRSMLTAYTARYSVEYRTPRCEIAIPLQRRLWPLRVLQGSPPDRRKVDGGVHKGTEF
jgi:hypothetical protein